MTELSISVSEPLWLSSPRDLIDLPDPENYTHTIRAFGGYWSASFDVTHNLMDAESWINGLGRHVVVYDDALVPCWEGCVNRVTINAGSRAFVRGPLLDLCNRLYVVYTRLLTVTDPPTRVGEDRTATVNDVDSQAVWGIIGKVVSGGEQTDANALRVRDTYLAENKEPRTTHQEAGRPGVHVECVGYSQLLTWLYSQTAVLGDVDLSNDDGTGKLQLVIAADPNGIFSTNWSRTADNAFQVNAYEEKDRRARDLIQAMVAYGDAAGSRWLFGIYAGRQAVYEAAPSAVEYLQVLGDPAQRITTLEGTAVKPWNVMPGRWLMYPDFLVGGVEPANLRDDPRMEFIESVTFTAPQGLAHSGGRTDRITQILAQKGLGGTYG